MRGKIDIRKRGRGKKRDEGNRKRSKGRKMTVMRKRKKK